ncbi:MAG: CBS domain-containing protein [Deltaproteobacteria bacterium]|nr:CBS domain-containing protein [Deltaproteobacteria bacterium]
MKLPVVRDHMDTTVHTLRPDAPILEAVDFLLEHHVTSAPVTDPAGMLIGIISEKDCLRLLAAGTDADVPRGIVADYMTRDVVTITPKMNVYYVAGLFLKNVFRRLPVVDEGKLVGAITRFDILRVIQKNLR